MDAVRIIGGGLAGSEAAWQVASRGVPVVLHEMRPVRPTLVHKTDRLAELVCSNSFRGDKLDNAVGLLKEEMRRLGSLIMRAADLARVPAGAALAVDRERFSETVTQAIAGHPLIAVQRREVAGEVGMDSAHASRAVRQCDRILRIRFEIDRALVGPKQRARGLLIGARRLFLRREGLKRSAVHQRPHATVRDKIQKLIDGRTVVGARGAGGEQKPGKREPRDHAFGSARAVSQPNRSSVT